MGTVGDVKLKVCIHVDKSFLIVLYVFNLSIDPIISCSQVMVSQYYEFKKFFYLKETLLLRVKKKAFACSLVHLSKFGSWYTHILRILCRNTPQLQISEVEKFFSKSFIFVS